MSRVKDLTMTCDPDDDQEVIGGEKFTLATGYVCCDRVCET